MHQNRTLIRISNVKNEYDRLFSHLKTPEPREGLLGEIMAKIETERVAAEARRRLWFAGATAIFSFTVFLPSVFVLKSATASSGFFNFIYLIFADTELIFMNLQDFSFAILESLPAFSMAFVLLSIYIFLESIKFINKELKIVYEFR